MISEPTIAFTGVPTAVSTEGGIQSSNTLDYQAPVGQGMKVRGVINLTAGTGTTAVVLRVRKGSITGALVGAAQTITLAAGASTNIAYDVLDSAPTPSPIDPQGAQSVGSNAYLLTLQQTGGTGAGTVNYGTISLQSAARTV